jgi:hypothetical protein
MRPRAVAAPEHRQRDHVRGLGNRARAVSFLRGVVRRRLARDLVRDLGGCGRRDLSLRSDLRRAGPAAARRLDHSGAGAMVARERLQQQARKVLARPLLETRGGRRPPLRRGGEASAVFEEERLPPGLIRRCGVHAVLSIDSGRRVARSLSRSGRVRGREYGHEGARGDRRRRRFDRRGRRSYPQVRPPPVRYGQVRRHRDGAPPARSCRT